MEQILVELDSGVILGTLDPTGTLQVFRGIPYAKPPVGNLRWRAPQPPEPWTGVRSAVGFGPRCVQVPISKSSQFYFPPEPESEDCLYLNVWAPVGAGRGCPVLVWFHGGSYTRLSGSLPIFDGGALAMRGIIVVALNYRLGRLGFLAHPELTLESEHHASGNYGLLDQVASLQWVKRNITEFGGDAGRVTIAGQSSGAFSTSALMTSPLAKGLFHRVIGQSGAMFGPVGEGTDIGDTIQDLPSAERSGVRLARRLGAGTLAELRSRSANEVQMARLDDGLPYGPGYDPAAMMRGRGAFDTGYPIIDGYVLRDAPRAVIAAGEHHDVPVLTGATAHERNFTVPAAPTVAKMIEEAHRFLGPLAPRFLKLYPAANDVEAAEQGGYANGDRLFVWQNFFWAREATLRGKSPAYLYSFTHQPPQPDDRTYIENPERVPRAYHGAELPYVFGTLGALPYPWQDEDRRLSQTVISYWVNFIESGDPNGNGLPLWSPFDPSNQTMMFIKDPPCQGDLPSRSKLELWDDFYGGKPNSMAELHSTRQRDGSDAPEDGGA